MRSLRLIGCFRVCVDGDTVVVPSSAQRLVALVALQQRLSRRQLAARLWPDAPDSRGQANLRTQLWRVNRVVPGLLATDADSLMLAGDVRVDVTELITHALAVLAGQRPPVTAPLPALEALLPDWDDSWLAPERERLRQLHLHLLEISAHQLREQGRFGLALESALAALWADDLRESAHAAVIAVHLDEGNLGEARRAYDRCVDVLRRELDLAPSSRLTDLVADRLGPLDSRSAPRV